MKPLPRPPAASVAYRGDKMGGHRVTLLARRRRRAVDAIEGLSRTTKRCTIPGDLLAAR